MSSSSQQMSTRSNDMKSDIKDKSHGMKDNKSTKKENDRNNWSNVKETLAEKAAPVVEKVKGWTGSENQSSGKQRVNQEVKNELKQQSKVDSEVKNQFEDVLSDIKTTDMSIGENTSQTTSGGVFNNTLHSALETMKGVTHAIGEKTGPVVDKVREWTGLEQPSSHIQVNEEIRHDIMQQSKVDSDVKHQFEDVLSDIKTSDMAINDRQPTTISSTIHSALETVKEVTHIISEKTGPVMDKVKGWTGMETSSDKPHHVNEEIKSELKEQSKVDNEIKSHFEDVLSDIKSSDMALSDSNPSTWGTTVQNTVKGVTSKIAEKTGPVVEKVKGWTGMETSSEKPHHVNEEIKSELKEQSKVDNDIKSHFEDVLSDIKSSDMAINDTPSWGSSVQNTVKGVTSKIAEKTAPVVEKVKGWTGMETSSDKPHINEEIKSELKQQSKVDSDIKNQFEDVLSDIKSSDMTLGDHPNTWGTTVHSTLETVKGVTSKIAEKTGPVVEKVKGWTGMETSSDKPHHVNEEIKSELKQQSKVDNDVKEIFEDVLTDIRS